MLKRPTQNLGDFAISDPLLGYYNNLAPVLDQFADESAMVDWLDQQLADRDACNPVSILQTGLAAWQSPIMSRQVPDRVAMWAAAELVDSARPLAYHWDMPHTYDLRAPWQSSMAFGQALSLISRVGGDQPDCQAAMSRAVAILTDTSEELMSELTPEGTVFQEYPTIPPAHVLNGWIWTLWGLHDASRVLKDNSSQAAASAAWVTGTKTLELRIPLYIVGRGWSRYDLYPHRIRHWASPFYHRLHIAQLRATAMLADSPVLAEWADRFEAGDRRLATRARAVSSKILFRLLSPRRKRTV